MVKALEFSRALCPPSSKGRPLSLYSYSSFLVFHSANMTIGMRSNVDLHYSSEKKRNIMMNSVLHADEKGLMIQTI